MEYELITTDVLVIGGGGAGLRAAIEASSHGVDVTVLSKNLAGRSGATPCAGSSFQAAIGHGDDRDSPECHYQDTVKIGRNLGDRGLIRALALEGVDRTLDLVRYGVMFRKEGDKFRQVQHPGQSYPRNLVLPGGGYGINTRLMKEIHHSPNVTLRDDHMITSLIEVDGRVIGAIGLNIRTGQPVVFQAKATIMATGGYEKLWDRTDTGPDVTGEGVSVALKAGATIIDLEMVLYYPAVIIYPEQAAGLSCQYESLIAERYIGGKLLNEKDEEFFTGPLPPRDVMMNLIFEEVEKGNGSPRGGVYIDVSRSSRPRSEIDAFLVTSPRFKNLMRLGIDLRTQRLEVAPAIHYTLGGIRINPRTETSLVGLYAAGEVAGNVHGANRISGNALVETQVFGARAGKYASEWVKQADDAPQLPKAFVADQIRTINASLAPKKNGLLPHLFKRQINKVADDLIAWKRSEQGLLSAVEKIRQMRDEDLPRLEVGGPRPFNVQWREALEIPAMLDLAEAVAMGALQRRESRGHHRRADHPETSPEFEKHMAVVLRDNRLQTFSLDIDE